MGLESTEAAVRWNNKLQALAENSGFGIPANNSSDPRHGAGSTAEYMGVTGEPISKWANGIGLSASFDPEQVREFGEIASAEYRALGIATALCDRLEFAFKGNIVTYASITAKPFFESRGYKVLEKQRVKRKEQFLTNFFMIKR